MPEQTNPLAEGDNEQTTLKIVTDWIIADDNIIKTLPLKEGQTGTYHVSMKGKPLSITSAALISGQGAFNTQIFDMFSILLPKVKSNEWASFITYIAQNAKDGGLEETNAGMAADIIFETICNEFDITQDKHELLDRGECVCLVEHSPHGEMYFVLPSNAVKAIYNDTKISTTFADVSQAMTTKGQKIKKTYDVKVDGQLVKCWYFVADIVNEQKGVV